MAQTISARIFHGSHCKESGWEGQNWKGVLRIEGNDGKMQTRSLTIEHCPHPNYRSRSSIKTTSLVVCPRVSRSRFLSRDQLKSKICPVMNEVNC